MRIGLNATCFNHRPSGARQRFLGLYGALIASQPDTEFVVYDPVDAPVSQWLGNRPNIIPRATPIPSSGRLRKTLAARGYWRNRLRADRLDLFEQFNLPLVKAPDCPTLLTVHDIRDAQQPAALRALYRTLWHRALDRADHVVTVSNAMRDEILDFHPAARVTTIYNGIDAAPFAAAAENKRAGDYLLAVGHLEPRKNYERLIEAVGRLAGAGREMKLVIVGRDGGARASVAAAINAFGRNDTVQIYSDVDDDALTQLYAGARLVVFPSTYEGFGIPILEAMAAERPLVLSDIPVFRELTDNVGIYFDPFSAPAAATAITAVLDHGDRARALVAYGKARVPDFSFPRLAAQLAALHTAVI